MYIHFKLKCIYINMSGIFRFHEVENTFFQIKCEIDYRRSDNLWTVVFN
jgi:hypothetical protein